MKKQKLNLDLRPATGELVWVNKPFLDYDVRRDKAYMEYVGAIMDENVVRTDYMILDAYRKGIRNIELLMHSFGGDVFAAVTLYYLLKGWEERGMKITTVVYGCVASAAVTPYLAGQERLATPHAMLMIHDIRSLIHYPYRTTSNQEQDAASARKIQTNMTTLEFIELRPKVVTREQIEDFKKQDFWMTAEEAKKYGFVDRIIYNEREDT